MMEIGEASDVLREGDDPREAVKAKSQSSKMGRIVGLVLHLILNRLMDLMGLKYDHG